MDTRKKQSCESAPDADLAISPRSRIRRSGRVPHSAFTDPRLKGLTVASRFVLVAAHAHAVRDESQRVNMEAAPTMGWLFTPTGEPFTVARLCSVTGCSDAEVRAALKVLLGRGLLVMSDAFVWGVPGWESESAPRVRNLRAKRAAQAAAEALDFHPFERKAQAAVTAVRPRASERVKAGPLGLGSNDAAIAERDNRRAMGRR